ncbi:hypothetical protein [Bacillus nitratireducens]|uniref:hypothetical protein n=1 Tax=Bacillus nitratireducens TaxID=2026193 RepID=UPI0033971E2D
MNSNRNDLMSKINTTYSVPNMLERYDMGISESLQEELAEHHREKEEYKQSVLKTLQSIEQNTGNLYQIVQLLNTQADKQDTIIELLTEVLAISTSATKEEAEGKYRTVMKKIITVTDDVETIQKLTGFAQMVFQMFQSLG